MLALELLNWANMQSPSVFLGWPIFQLTSFSLNSLLSEHQEYLSSHPASDPEVQNSIPGIGVYPDFYDEAGFITK